MNEPLLAVEELRKRFVTTGGFPRRRTVRLRAEEDLSFGIALGEAFGLVGEGGYGKSTAARALLRVIERDAGIVSWYGEDVLAARGTTLKVLLRRLRNISQDPHSSLDPRQTIGSALVKPMRVHGFGSGAAGGGRPAVHRARPPPHEVSGGKRHRIGIARALTVEPELILADEPVGALDVSVQAQVLLLLLESRERCSLSFLLVSHDLPEVRWFCDRVAVTHLDRIMEEGLAARVLGDPLHPYVRMLRDASPVPDPARRGVLPRIGEIPSAAIPPSGCPFHPRCTYAMPACAAEMSPLRHFGLGRRVACQYAEESNTREPAP